MYRLYAKRALDIFISVFVLALFLPLWLLIGAAIAVDSPGGFLFAQERIGYRGKLFRLLKFRTMVKDAYKIGKRYYFQGECDPRITHIGKVLRRISLDEIPQLVNVIKGEMSLVGPRPMLPYQYEYLSDAQKRRFAVRPGITGLAQVKGRNTIPWSQRIEFDIRYVNGVSPALDLQIVAETVWSAFAGKGVEYDLDPSAVEDFIYGKEDSPHEHPRVVGDTPGSRAIRHGGSAKLS